MFSQETVGLAAGAMFGLVVLLVFLYLLLNARNAAIHLVAVFIVFLPLMNSPSLPGQVFGIRGLSPVNFITAIACLAIFAKLVNSGRTYGYITRFLSVPLAICIVVFVFSATLTYFGGDDHLYFQGASSITFKLSQTDFLLYECIRPLQIILVGFLVMVACDVTGDKRLIQRALLIAPVVLSFLALVYSLDSGLGNYKASRMMLGARLGMHSNGFGALSVYFLVAAIAMREHDWPRVRYAAIAFSLLGVVLSYSRIAFIATILLLAMLYFRLPAKEKVVVGGMAVAVILVFSAQLIARIQYGISDFAGGVDVNTVSAGRVTDIWLPGLRQFLEQPIFGYGIGTLVDSPTVGRWIPHNAYLEILLNSGLVGFLAIANLIFWSIRYCVKNDDETGYLIVAMLILGLTGHTFYPNAGSYVIWVFYGMLVHSRYAAKQETEVQNTSITSGRVRGLHEQLTN